MKWHIMAAPAYIKAITVPADYNQSQELTSVPHRLRKNRERLLQAGLQDQQQQDLWNIP